MKVALQEGTNTYWSARLLRDADGAPVKKVIIETSYPLVLTQSNPDVPNLPAVPADTVRKLHEVLKFADLEVYAEDVTIHGPISVPGKSVTIVARVIHTWPSEKGLPKISVDGVDSDARAGPPEAAKQGAFAKSDATNTKGKKDKGINGKQGIGQTIPYKPFGGGTVMTPGENGESRGDPSHHFDVEKNYDPVMDGEPGEKGAEGQKGGTIILHAWRFDLWDPASADVPCPFTLSACGGAGGKGQDGQPGADGGAAGDGANFVEGFYTLSPSPNGQPGSGGNGGLGGPGGKGGNGGMIDIRIVENKRHLFKPQKTRFSDEIWVETPSRVIQNFLGGSGGDGGGAGLPGMGGKGGKGGKGAGRYFPFLGPPEPSSSWAAIVRDGFPETLDLGRGSYGNQNSPDIYSKVPLDKPNPVRGVAGDPGTVRVISPATPAQVGMLRWESQLQMVLESVRARYLAAGFEPDDSIKTDLNYLAEVLKVVRDAPAANTAEKNITGQSLNTVALLMRNLATGCDVFGHAAQFVPMLSVATHQQALKESLAVLEDNQKHYTNYTKELEKATDSARQMDEAAQQAAGVKAYMEGKLRKLNQDRKETQKTIDGFKEKIDGAGGAKDKLKGELNNLTEEIYKEFGLSTGTLLNCLTQVAFLGVPLEKTMLQPAGGGAPVSGIGFSGLHAMNSALLGSTQVATALNEGLTSVLNDAGEPVKKEHILERLEAIAPGKLDDHLKARQDGTYKVDDGRKLSIMREDLEHLCHQFRSLHTQTLTVAMNQYVDLIDERGRHLLKYNSQVAEQFELMSEIRAATAMGRAAESAKAEADLNTLPEMTALVSSLHNRSRMHCLNELALAYRALAFWKGEPCGNVADLIPGKLSTVNYQTLNNAWLRVQSEIIDHLEKASSPPQRFPASLDEHIKRSKHSPFGVWIVLASEEYPDEFADLQEGLPAKFTFRPDVGLMPPSPPKPEEASPPGVPTLSVPLDLPPMVPVPEDWGKGKEEIFPFHGKADVRLSQVRVFFPGLPSAKLLTVKVTHDGHECIQNPNRKIVEFLHNQQMITFAYKPPKDGPWIDEEEGWVAAEALQVAGSVDGSLGLATDKTALPSCSYTPLGPFTTWTIDLPPEDNRHLDRLLEDGTKRKIRSKIERIVLDFHGFFHEFAARR